MKKRTTHYGVAGTKLHKVRNAKEKFEKIVEYTSERDADLAKAKKKKMVASRLGALMINQKCPIKIDSAKTYTETGKEIGVLKKKKNKAYGDSFHKSGEILKILFPNGIAISQYKDMLYIVRVVDKLFRLATDKDAFGENPAKDIAGYSILKAR